MKQIFDWLRDYIYRNSYKNDVEVITQEDALAMIDEAEAKWEADCCEWKHKEYHSCCLSECNGVYEDYDSVLGWEFCPYCGKPIKIVEVE